MAAQQKEFDYLPIFTAFVSNLAAEKWNGDFSFSDKIFL